MELNVVKIIGSHGDAMAFSSKISPRIEKSTIVSPWVYSKYSTFVLKVWGF